MNEQKENETLESSPMVEELLLRGDEKEREVAQRFLEESRPVLVAGKRLGWDGFWRQLAQGFDSFLWRWFGGDVDVARAQEAQRAEKRRRTEMRRRQDKPN